MKLHRYLPAAFFSMTSPGFAQPPEVVKSAPNGNTAVGGAALYNLTAGSANTAAGAAAMYPDTAGSRNTAIGYTALELNDSGNDNVALG